MSYRHQPGYHGEQPTDANGVALVPIGYGSDPAGVFSTEIIDNELILRISGEVYGCLFTQESFANYRLQLKVKWGEKKWPPRLDKLRDSGIVYHSIGDAGVDYWRAWMLGQEFQIMEGHNGDYWPIASAAIDIRAFLPEGAMNAIASNQQPFLPFGAEPSVSSLCLRSENLESPVGEWTELELVCFEDKSLHIVNGVVVMTLRNSRYADGGAFKPLTSGKIQLQSEASETLYKDIRIQPLANLPEQYRSLFD